MHKLRITYTGPADKLVVNGVFYRKQFENEIASANSTLSATGAISFEPVNISVPGVCTRDVLFDTEANALAFRTFLLNQPELEKSAYFVDRAGYLAYNIANSIVVTSAVIPA